MPSQRRTSLGQQQLDYLMAHTIKVMPDNPTQQGYSATTIKKLYYQGYQIIFEWLKNIESSGVEFDNELQTQISEIKVDVLSLQGDSENFYKQIDVLNQKTQKLINDVDDLFVRFGWHTYSLTIKASVIDGQISGSLSPSDIQIIDDYLTFNGGKILDLLIVSEDKTLIFLHTRTTKSVNKYNIVAVAVLNNAELFPITLEIVPSGLMYIVNGEYKEVITRETLSEELTNYVKKSDIVYENGIFTLNF